MSNPQNAIILIIEDDPHWQSIFEEIATDMGYWTRIVDSYEMVVHALTHEHGYALAIVDISLSMPHHDNRDGVSVLRFLAAAPYDLPAIVVTGYATVDLAVETLVELEAVNFFRKDDFDRRKFIRAMEAELGQGEVQVPAIFCRKIATHVAEILSERELEVLYRLSQGQTNKEIAEELIISVNTVKKHVQNIFTKLNVTNRAAAVTEALIYD